MAETKVIEVVGGIIRREGKFLLGRRPLGKSQGGKWEFIGGKIESGETPEQALTRECMEEIALPIINTKIRTSVTHAYPDRTIHLTLIDCEPAPDAEPKALEHDALGWFTAADALKLDFCPADIEMLPVVFKERGRAMKEGKTLFVAVCRVWPLGGTRDLLAVETEARSQLGNMICKVLDGRTRVEMGKDWLTNLVELNLLKEYDSKDALKEMAKFINNNLQMDLRVVIGEAGRSHEMPDGKSCLKVSCWHLHAGGGCLSKSTK